MMSLQLGETFSGFKMESSPIDPPDPKTSSSQVQ